MKQTARHPHREKKLETSGKDYKATNGEMVHYVTSVMIKTNNKKDGLAPEVKIQNNAHSHFRM